MASGNYGRHFDNFPYPQTEFGYWYDFCSDEDITEGVFTAISSGTNTVLDTASGGRMTIASNGAAASSGGEWLVDGANIIVSASPNKIIRWQSCIQISAVANSVYRGGLVNLMTSWIANSGSVLTDGIYFSKSDTATTLDFVVRGASTNTLTATGIYTLANATDAVISLQITPAGTTGVASRIEAWVGPNTVGTVPQKVMDQQVNTVVPLASILLTSGHAFQTGASATAGNLQVDYHGARVLR